MKYLGIILGHKFRFQEHIKYETEMCAKLIHSLTKAAKMTWEIKHATMATINTGAILPLLLYGAPIWIEAMNYEHNRWKYIRVQRLINVSMAKAYRTTSSEALSMLTGTTAIIIKHEEVAQRYNAKERTGDCKIELDHEVELENWLHRADVVTIEEV
jgi:hypothetical protein